jgi:predicted nucleic acid-binding Zn ribbon protein
VARRDFQALKELLPGVLSRLAREGGSARALQALWEEVAGPVIARHATPIAWKDRTLVIAVSAAWKKELEGQRAALLDGLRARLKDSAPSSLTFQTKT